MNRAPSHSERADEWLRPEVMLDPHALHARLRDRHPIARIGETGVHAVTSWALVEEALGREADFSANLTGVLYRGEHGGPDVFPLGDVGASQVIATADDPDHAVDRAIVRPRLERPQVAAMAPRLREWTRAALDPFLAAAGGDLVPIAERIPALAVANLLGLPEDDVDRFRVWAMMGGDMLAGEVDGPRMARLATETAAMGAYLGAHLDRVAGAPDADDGAPLLHALARGVARGEIDRERAVGIAIVLFGAGGESTAALLGSAVARLAADQALAGRLREDPSLVPRFVEEVVRLEPPFNFHYRAVRRACRLGGYDLVPGDRLMLVWAAANRDPTVFDDPDRLRLDRRHPKRHMGFGRGMHFCVGAPLARLEARILIETLLARTHTLSLRGEDAMRWTRSIFVRRLEALTLDVVPRPEALARDVAPRTAAS